MAKKMLQKRFSAGLKSLIQNLMYCEQVFTGKQREGSTGNLNKMTVVLAFYIVKQHYGRSSTRCHLAVQWLLGSAQPVCGSEVPGIRAWCEDGPVWGSIKDQFNFREGSVDIEEGTKRELKRRG
ncbi:hypothetical protein C8R44DRAFT_736104 [Mycena epipterygia]|nr:hypothetical protein C8R44DRAFT_736104 [Mycena epipterygia]